jgi:hypothetical protein
VRLQRLLFLSVISAQALVATSCLGPGFPAAPPTIVTQPANQTVIVGQPATFTVQIAGGPGSYSWQRNGVPIPGAVSAAYTTPPPTMADDNAEFRVTVTNALATVSSNVALLQVHDVYDVTTWHNDNARTGQNLGETLLTQDNVNSNRFGKIGFFPVDGKVDGQPLFLANVAVPGLGTRNILLVTTEHDSVYAFNADTGAVIWQVSLLGAGESPSDPRGANVITPEIGISSTPVADRTLGPHGALYVAAMSKDADENYFQRIHALDITSGAELFNGPVTIAAQYPGLGDPGVGVNTSGGDVFFFPAQYKERAALLLSNGVVYTSWSSHDDFLPYQGWIIGYDASTLTQTGVWNSTPNAAAGSFWNSGSGPAVDSEGNLYLLVANGVFDSVLDANGFPEHSDYGNAFIKVSPAGGKLTLIDYFEMMNELDENNADHDLGSGGTMVLPDLTDNAQKVWHLAVGAGKDGNIYVVNRDSMGKFNPVVNNIYQEVIGVKSAGSGLSGGVFSGPAYFNNTVYYCANSDSIKAFPISDAQLPEAPAQETSVQFRYPGATPSISANGSSNAILWAIETVSIGGVQDSGAVLHAFDATNLSDELYNSDQAANSRDQFGAPSHFMTPTIANGKVYIGTQTGVAVFGLLQ